MVGAWALHELVKVVKLVLLGYLPTRSVMATNAELAGRRRSFLFFLSLYVEGPSSWSLRLALPLSWPLLKTALTTSSLEVRFMVMSSRSRVVRGFWQPS